MRTPAATRRLNTGRQWLKYKSGNAETVKKTRGPNVIRDTVTQLHTDPSRVTLTERERTAAASNTYHLLNLVSLLASAPALQRMHALLQRTRASACFREIGPFETTWERSLVV